MKKNAQRRRKHRAGCSKADPQTNKQTNTHTHTHTHTQTNTDKGDYNTLRSLARSCN